MVHRLVSSNESHTVLKPDIRPGSDLMRAFGRQSPSQLGLRNVVSGKRTQRRNQRCLVYALIEIDTCRPLPKRGKGRPALSCPHLAFVVRRVHGYRGSLAGSALDSPLMEVKEKSKDIRPPINYTSIPMRTCKLGSFPFGTFSSTIAANNVIFGIRILDLYCR
jgi:hypothetical protein